MAPMIIIYNYKNTAGRTYSSLNGCKVLWCIKNHYIFHRLYIRRWDFL